MMDFKADSQLEFVLVGGGGHCRSCINSIIRADNKVLGIIDNDSKGNILDFPVIGSDKCISRLVTDNPNANFIVAVGMIKGTSLLRQKLFEKLLSHNAVKKSIISKSSAVSPFAKIGLGSTILEGVSINANAVIGDNTIINTGAIIEHDSYIGDHSHISTGAIVNGGVCIGKNCMIGSGSVILQGIKIVANTTIAAGSVVTKDITVAGTWIGTPAKRKDEQNVE